MNISSDILIRLHEVVCDMKLDQLSEFLGVVRSCKHTTDSGFALRKHPNQHVSTFQCRSHNMEVNSIAKLGPQHNMKR